MENFLRLDVGGGVSTDVSWIELAFGLHAQGFQFWHRPRGFWEPIKASALHA